jgi:hypothetical protein
MTSTVNPRLVVGNSGEPVEFTLLAEVLSVGRQAAARAMMHGAGAPRAAG